MANKLMSCLVAAVALALAAPASGQATRTWVSGVGDDVNPCSRTAPCKTFAGAISKTAANGEINVIDPGGFGAVTITKSITIDGHGPQSSVLAFGSSGIIVNGAGIVVNLRNLSINGAGSAGGSGIRILNAASVNIDDVHIFNFAGTGTAGRGISIESAAADVRVSVSNSLLYNINNGSIVSAPTAGNVLLDVDRVRMFRGGGRGIDARTLTRLTLSTTTIAQHGVDAAVALGSTSTSAHISDSVLSNNRIGVLSGGAGGATQTVWLDGNVITGNTLEGLRINSGSILSYGNNAISDNGGNENPTAPVVPLK